MIIPYLSKLFFDLLKFFDLVNSVACIRAMKNLFLSIYNGIMDADWNPLSAIPSVAMRHLIMQLLSWMWCIIFSLYFGSFIVFGITVAAHFLLIFGTFMTAATFAAAPRVVNRELFKK